MGQLQDNLKQLCLTKGLKYVGTRGQFTSPICIVGEAPGESEELSGIPFVGASGKLLDRILGEAGFNTTDLWFTNPYKVRPPDNKLSRLAELGIPLNVYEDAFQEELEETKPTFIICAGAVPTALLCPFTRDRKSDKTGVTKWRGSLLTSSLLRWPHYIIPILHPAYLLRDWSEKDTNVFILKKINEEFEYFRKHGKLQPLPERELIVAPDANVALQYLDGCLHQSEAISVDIENIRRPKLKGEKDYAVDRTKHWFPITISFARNPFSALSLSFWDYSDVVLPHLWRVMERILSTHSIIGQNYTSFDAHWLYRLGFNPNCQLVDDTRVRHNLLWPELSHKLEFMVMQYTREPFYKDEGKTWTVKDKTKLMRYNAKDAACTYEVYLGQEEEFNERPTIRNFYDTHERPLAGAFFNIDKRGVFTDSLAIDELRKYISVELRQHAANIESTVGRPIVSNAKEAKRITGPSINIGSSSQVISLLKSRGLKIKKKRGTGNESVGEEELNEMFAETNDPVLKEILDIRELNKILTTNVDCRLIDDTYYSVYIVGGTVGGRRSSKSNPIGFGGNGQNIPKHSKLGKKFRRCLIARPGKILIQCDQVGAEDWIINGIIADETGERRAVDELIAGVDRHQRLASYIFGVPLDQCSRDSQTIYRYVGKRTRYAGTYGMRGTKFAAVLAKEGFSLPSEHCDFILKKFHEYDPGIEGVFQKYVERELVDHRLLRDLFGRERQFFGLHPYRDNSTVFREAYSYIPQSTIGDNNGAAVLYCEEHNANVIGEVHDSIILEVDDNVESVLNAVQILKEAYNRVLRFPKGFELQVPIELELGYNLQDLVRTTQENLRTVYESISRSRDEVVVTTSN